MKLFRHWWMKVLIGVAVLVLLIAVGFFNSSLRARSEAAGYREQLEKQGEVFDVTKLAPPGLAPGSNYASVLSAVHARLKSLPEDVLSTNTISLPMVAPGKQLVGWREPYWNRFDWASNSWSEVAAAVAEREVVFEPLFQLPADARMDFHINYSDLMRTHVPFLAERKMFAQQLASMAACNLHAGESAKAVRAANTLLTLITASDDDRVLISELVRFATTAIASTATFQILQADGLTDGDLKSHQERWGRLQFAEPLEHAFTMERAVMPLLIAEMRASPDPARNTLFGVSPAPSSPPSGLIEDLKELGDSVRSGASELAWRTSWSYTDERRARETAHLIVQACRRIRADAAFKPTVDWLAAEMSKRGLDNSAHLGWLRRNMDSELLGLFNLEAGLSRTLGKALQAEATKQIVIAAIALKRFQLRHGEAPERLEALVPEFLPGLPKDPVDGKPLRYRRETDGTFLLYSIGDNGTDEGGSTATGAKSLWWLRANDWVWPQAASEAEVEAYRRSRR